MTKAQRERREQAIQKLADDLMIWLQWNGLDIGQAYAIGSYAFVNERGHKGMRDWMLAAYKRGRHDGAADARKRLKR